MPLLAVAQPPMDMERMLHQVCITITITTIIATNRHCADLCHPYHQHLCHLKSLALSRRQTTIYTDQRLKHTSMNGAQLTLVLKVTQHHE